jgi:hypothetical protein
LFYGTTVSQTVAGNTQYQIAYLGSSVWLLFHPASHCANLNLVIIAQPFGHLHPGIPDVLGHARKIEVFRVQLDTGVSIKLQVASILVQVVVIGGRVDGSRRVGIWLWLDVRCVGHVGDENSGNRLRRGNEASRLEERFALGEATIGRGVV